MATTFLKRTAALAPAFLLCQASARDPLWERVASLPGGNAGFARGVAGGRIVVAGGTNWKGDQKETLDRVIAYSPAEDTWHEIGRLPMALAYGAFAVFDNCLYLIGGDNGTATQAGGWAVGLDGSSRAWKKLPQSLAYPGSVQYQGWLYLLGGTEDMRDLSKCTAGLWRVRGSGGGVERLPDFPGGCVIHAALAVAGKRIFAFPGGTMAEAGRRLQNTQQTWSYQPKLRQWNEVAPYPFPVRGVAACVLGETSIMVAGGLKDPDRSDSGPGFTADCFLYDVVGNRYHALPPLPYAAMQIGLVKHGGWLYLIGGEDRSQHRSAAVHRVSIPALEAAALE